MYPKLVVHSKNWDLGEGENGKNEWDGMHGKERGSG